jgi:hypothetical protein
MNLIQLDDRACGHLLLSPLNICFQLLPFDL